MIKEPLKPSETYSRNYDGRIYKKGKKKLHHRRVRRTAKQKIKNEEY